MKNVCGGCHKEYDLSKVRVHETHPFNFCKCPHCGATNIVKPIEGAPEEEKKNEAVRIYEFDFGIYPQKLWVTIDAPIHVLRDLFDEKDIGDWAYNGACRTTATCRKKPEKKGGVLIELTSANLTPDNIAHEAAHAAWMIVDYCNLEVDAEHTEQFCYLVGWIVECVHSVVEGKELDKNITFNYTMEDGKQ